jgi:hypothetical protein
MNLMKWTIKATFLAMVCLATTWAGFAQDTTSFWQTIKNPETFTQLESFVAAKEAQANAAAKADGKGMPAEYKAFFHAADKGDWLTVSNMFEKMGVENGVLEGSSTNVDMAFRGIRWEAAREIWGAFDAFSEGNEKYSTIFGNEIIQSIPPGSIYFCGSAPGRFIVSALQKSQIKGEPFFTMTQNALQGVLYRPSKPLQKPSVGAGRRCNSKFKRPDAGKRQRGSDGDQCACRQNHVQ